MIHVNPMDYLSFFFAMSALWNEFVLVELSISRRLRNSCTRFNVSWFQNSHDNDDKIIIQVCCPPFIMGPNFGLTCVWNYADNSSLQREIPKEWRENLFLSPLSSFSPETELCKPARSHRKRVWVCLYGFDPHYGAYETFFLFAAGFHRAWMVARASAMRSYSHM